MFRAFRLVFNRSDEKPRTEARLYVQGRYHAWINGVYLGRGPCYHHPHEVCFDAYDLSPHIQAGRNVLAVLVYDPQVATFYHVPTGRPGLWAQVLTGSEDGPGQAVVEPEGTWRVTDEAGFQTDVPRRTLAIDHVECFDARWAPTGWREIDFDDTLWDTPTAVPRASCIREIKINPQPRLRFEDRPAKTVMQNWSLGRAPQPLAWAPDTLDRDGLAGTEAYAASLMDAGWHALSEGQRVSPDADQADGPVTVDGLTKDRGGAVLFDLGAEYVGEPYLTATAESEGVIDLGFAESLDERGQPQLLMKHGSYANRILARSGTTAYEAIRYSGLRYLVVMLRGFDGSVRIDRVGVRSSTADLPLAPRFQSDNPALDDLFELSVRTLKLGCQEGLVDCPTREQSMYVGDGHPMARWVHTLTGDVSYWRRLVTQQFARPAPNGLIRSTVFSSGAQMLLDYNLLAVSSLHDYATATGDYATVRQLLPQARGVLGWFERLMDERGLCWLDTETLPWRSEREAVFDPDEPRGEAMQRLFIDHAGVGWHNLDEPGIDRRGLNAALQALLCMVESALAEVEEAVGDAARANRLRGRAKSRRDEARRRFLDPMRSVFCDGELDGQRLSQISQQTNVWAVLAGWCELGEDRPLLESLFDQPPEDAALCGPYFWIYAVPALRRVGLLPLMLRGMEERWGPMLAEGATAMWETFAGDALDSRCHPWSGAPIDAVLSGVLGLSIVSRSPGEPPRWTLQPEPWVLGKFDLSLPLPGGGLRCRWRRDGSHSGLLTVERSGELAWGGVIGTDGRCVDPISETAGKQRADDSHRSGITETYPLTRAEM